MQLQKLRPAFLGLPVTVLPLAVLLLKRADPAEQQIALDPPHLAAAHQILRPEKPTQRVARLQPLFLKRHALAHPDLCAALGVFPQNNLHRLPVADLQGHAPALQTAVVPDFRDKIHLLDLGEAGVGLRQERADLGRLVRQDLHLKLRGLLCVAALCVLQFEARGERSGQVSHYPRQRGALRGHGKLLKTAVLVAEPGGPDGFVKLELPAHRRALRNRELSRVFKSALRRLHAWRVVHQGVGTLQLWMLKDPHTETLGAGGGRLHPVLQVALDRGKTAPVQRLRQALLHRG